MKSLLMPNDCLLLSSRRGAFMVLAALAIPVLIGSMGLAVDIGHLQLSRMKVSNALDAAAVAGIIKATSFGDRATAEPLAERIGEYNLEKSGFSSANVTARLSDIDGLTRIDVEASNVQAKVFFLQILALAGNREITLINLKAAATRTPALVALVLDTSESMKWGLNDIPKIVRLKAAAKEFVDTFDLGMDRLALIGFGDQGKVYLPMPIKGPEQNRQAIMDAIDSMQPSGATNIAEGIALGRTQIERVLPKYEESNIPVMKMIVLVTDGAPTVYRGNFTAIRQTHPALEAACRDQGFENNGVAKNPLCWSPWKFWNWSTRRPADVDRNGVIEENDFTIMGRLYNKNIPALWGKSEGDLNGDGFVNWDDVIALIPDYIAQLNSVPQPAIKNPTIPFTNEPEIPGPQIANPIKLPIRLHPNNGPIAPPEGSSDPLPPIVPNEPSWPDFNAPEGSGFQKILHDWQPLVENPGLIDIPGSNSGFNYLVEKNLALMSNNDPNNTTRIYPPCADDPKKFSLFLPNYLERDWGADWYGKSPLRDCLMGLASKDTKNNLHDDFKLDISKESQHWNPLRYGNTYDRLRWMDEDEFPYPSMQRFPYYAAIREAELAKRKPKYYPGAKGIQIFTVGIGQAESRGPQVEHAGCYQGTINTATGKFEPTINPANQDYPTTCPGFYGTGGGGIVEYVKSEGEGSA